MAENKNVSNSIDTFLTGQGYRQTARSGNMDVMVYTRQTSFGVEMITMVDMVHHPEIKREYVDQVVNGMTERIRMITHHEPKNLSLIIGERSEKGLDICKQSPNSWYLDALDSKMYLYENQLQDFNGLRGPLEQWISGKGVHIPKVTNLDLMIPRRSIVALVLLILNALMFILYSQGIVSDRALALDAESILQRREYYRFFTCMFMHGNFLHILYNMMVLWMVGPYVNHFYGWKKMTAGYLLSGLGGGILSMIYSVKTGNIYATVGASGAIYGLFGMATIYLFTHKKSFGRGTIFRMGLAFLCLFMSSAENTDVAAHLGGFLTGLLLAGIFALFSYFFGNKDGASKEKEA